MVTGFVLGGLVAGLTARIGRLSSKRLLLAVLLGSICCGSMYQMEANWRWTPPSILKPEGWTWLFATMVDLQWVFWWILGDSFHEPHGHRRLCWNGCRVLEPVLDGLSPCALFYRRTLANGPGTPRPALPGLCDVYSRCTTPTDEPVPRHLRRQCLQGFLYKGQGFFNGPQPRVMNSNGIHQLLF